jgi:hypothetical protein
MGQYHDEWKRYNRAIRVLAEAPITVGLTSFRIIKAAGSDERTANVDRKIVAPLHQC